VASSGNTPSKQTGSEVEFSTIEEESSAMKQSRFSDSQIMAILKQAENARLKKMYIETQIKNGLLSEALGKKP
jgi:hypothetical protein